MGNKNIIFITPPYDRIGPGYEYVRYITNNSPSLGLLSLAAIVRQNGYSPSIIECDVFNLSMDEVAQRVIAEKPSYVGITLFTVGVWSASIVAKQIKEALPSTTVIVGGPHISSMGSETMERFLEFDLAIVGEGEQPLALLLDALENGADLDTVPNLIYRKDGKTCRSMASAPQIALDDLPMPAWDLLPKFPEAFQPAIYDFPKGPVASIAASRGCPFHCKFCDTSTFGDKVRRCSPEVVFDMMYHLQKTYNVQHILFVDDLFLANPARTTALCNLILERGLKITWNCAARVDTVKPEILALMKKAGCWQISFGLETGSDELLKKMNKIATVEKSERAMNWTSQAGIRSKGLFILGFPGETRETIRKTKEFIRRVPMSVMNLTKFTPYPGSPIYHDLYGTNIRDDHWELMNGMNFLWTPEEIGDKELNKEYRRILTSFYGRQRIALSCIKLTFHNPEHLKRLVRFGIGYAKAELNKFFAGLGRVLFLKPARSGN